MRDIIRITMAVSGAALVLLGALGGVAWLVWPFVARDAASLFANTLFAGGAALGVVYGGVLFLQAFRGEDAAAPWPPASILLLLWGGIVVLGAITFSGRETDSAAPWVFPVLHVLAVLLPVGAILAFAARRVDVPAGRVALQLVHGGVGAFVVSLLLEGVSLAVFLAVLGTLGVLPAGLGQLLPPFLNGDLGALRDGLRESPVLLAFGVLFYGALVPLIEEAAKALTLPLWRGWQPTRNRALIWGLAAGLGLALSKSMFNALGGALTGLWWLTMVTLGGRALLHGMTTALIGLGWWRSFASGRRLSLIGAYIGAVILHAFWNVAMLVRTVVREQAVGTTSAPQGPALDLVFSDLLLLGAGLLLVILAGMLIRLTAPPRWSDAPEV